MTKTSLRSWLCLTFLLVATHLPATATIQIVSMRPNLKPPQKLGTSVTWVVIASDTNPGPLTFQFNVAGPGASFEPVKDFNVGSLYSGNWVSLPFVWTPSTFEGRYQVQVVVKDFATGETATKTYRYPINPVATTGPAVTPTSNPLVALFSAPSCPAGTSMRVSFKPHGATYA